MTFKTLTAALSLAALTATGALAETKIGFLTTLSGGGAGLGADARDGFLLGLKNGGAGDVEVIVEDDQRKPDVAVQAADKMIQSEKVDIMSGIIFSNIAMAVVPSATARDVFYISNNAGPSQLAGRGCHPLYFNVAWQNDNLHEAAGAYANDEGYKKSFMMAPNYPAGKDAITGYKRTYGGESAGEVYTKLGQTDYAAEIAQIRASGADSVFFFLPGGMGIAFLKQYADSGVDIPVIGPAFSFDQMTLQAVGDAALGIRNTSQWNKDLDNAANAKFVESFQTEYSRLPSLYAQQAYDTGLLIASALEKAKPSDTAAFQKALEAAEFESTRGAFRFGPNHHPIQDLYVREVVKEGDVYTNKIVGPSLKDHGDAYAAECKM